MAYTYVCTHGGTTFTFRWDLSPVLIQIDVGTERLFASDLRAAIREAEASEDGRQFPQICKAEGLAVLEEDGLDVVMTALTITLHNGTLIDSLKTSGKFYLKGGNVVPDVGYTDIIRENPLVTYYVQVSESGTVARVSTGSGLAPDERAAILSTNTNTATIISEVGIVRAITEAMQAVQLTAQRFIDLTFKRVNTIVGGLITRYRAGDEINVDVTYDADKIPTSEEPE